MDAGPATRSREAAVHAGARLLLGAVLPTVLVKAGVVLVVAADGAGHR